LTVPSQTDPMAEDQGEALDWSDLDQGDPEPRSRTKGGKGKAAEPGPERVPPQDLLAEQCVLGSMLLSKDVIAEITFVVSPDDYYRPAHELIHRVVLDLFGRGEPADPITVASELTKRGEIVRVGGPSYLHTLVNSVPTAANGEYYAEIVREKAVLRRLVEAGTRIAQMGYAEQGEVDALAAAAAQEIAAVVESRGRADDYVLPAQALPGTLDLIQAAQDPKRLTGVRTGFLDLDSLTGGLQPGQLVIVAGRPGHGKSTLAMDFARTAAIRDKIPTAFISLEMSVDELLMRALSADGRVVLRKLRTGGLVEADWDKLTESTQRLSDSPLHIDESSRSLPELQAKLRRLKHRTPDLGLVIVDYMQLITLGGRKRPDVREQEVAEISRSLKLLAKELRLPIVALAQLNRGPEMRSDKKPIASDLRESGSQEQDADLIILLHRPDAYEAESPRAGETDLIIAKHRNGATPTITVAAQLHVSRFVDMATEGA